MSDQIDKKTTEESEIQAPNPPDEDLTLYPLREPTEDPRWAVKTVWVWVSIAMFLIIFILVLLIAGLWYD